MPSLLVFDGLGGMSGDVLGRLQRLGTDGAHAAYFESVCATLDGVRRYVGDESAEATALPDGSEFRRMLVGATTAPTVNSVAEALLVHVYQACLLQPGHDQAPEPVGAIGHSLGTLGAILAGARTPHAGEFLRHSATALRLLAVTLVRCHQVVELDQGDGSARERYTALNPRTPRPGPMASISGTTPDVVVDLLAERDGLGSVVVALTNTPTAMVLSGHPRELLTLSERIRQVPGHPGRWTFLSSSVPFHNPLLGPALDSVEGDRDFIGELPRPTDLRLAVHGTDGAGELRARPDLISAFLRLTLLDHVDWPGSVRAAVQAERTDVVVDFGPGPGARRFARECLDGAAGPLKYSTVRPAATSQRGITR